MTMGAVLYIFAREPRLGEVKTRLASSLGPAPTLRLYRAFLLDTAESMAELVQGRNGVAVRLAADRRPRPWLESLGRRFSFPVEGQGGGDLGTRMERVLKRRSSQSGATVIIGSDSPDLPASRIVDALDALKRSPVALGPTTDGGYYLIAVRGQPPPIFNLGDDWGGARVMAETSMRLEEAGVAFAVLEPWFDVDDLASLTDLLSRLESRPLSSFGGTARHTLELVRQLRREGVLR